MTDRIVLAGMAFQARHGVNDWEKTQAQRFEVDLELELDLRPAGRDDDLALTAVAVRVRKPEVKLGGPLDYAGVEIRRAREA